MKYTYSIIIPHHNIPHLLKRCLSSIPQREDTQVIVIDDKSNENYLPALQLLEKEFDWTTFIYTKEGKGAGYARNIGLSHAKGDYILFADADDFFNYCIGQILDEYAESQYDAVFFDANSLDTNTYTTAYRCLHLNKIIMMYDKNPAKAIFNLKFKFGEPWCRMVRREIIEKNNIRFSETTIHNDLKYCYCTGYYSKNIQVDKRALYCVTERYGSVSKQISIERWIERTYILAEANNFMRNHKINFYIPKELRGIIYFSLKGDMLNAKKCYSIIRKFGTSQIKLAYRLLYYPFCALQKILNKMFIIPYIVICRKTTKIK